MRNRYLDLLRAAAILRVVVYHLFGWPWLSIVLPAMGVMFALAGSLTAASLQRRAAEQVVASRLRRLLPPLWLLGMIAVPVMLVAGWTRETGGEHPFSSVRLLFWLVPIADPPGSDQIADVWQTLWYIRAYLWFVLLSPVLFVIYRRIGWAAVALPLVLVAVLDITGLTLPGAADAAMWDFVTYGACWVAGFAHQDGRLAGTKSWILMVAAGMLGAASLLWLHHDAGDGSWDLGSWDLNDVAESQALWSLAVVLLVLRWQPPMGWLARVRPLEAAVNLINARAVTIYLWHNIAIAAVWPVLTVFALDDLGARADAVTDLALALVLTFGAVLAFGWAEDLAARRRPRLWPAGRSALRTEPIPEQGGPPQAGPVSSRPAQAGSVPAGPGPRVDEVPVVRLVPQAYSVPHTPRRRPGAWPPMQDGPQRDGEATGGRQRDSEEASGRQRDDEAAGGRHSAGGTGRDPGMPVAGPPAVQRDVAGGSPGWFRERRGGRGRFER